MSFAKNARMLASRGTRFVQTRGYADEIKLTFAATNKTFYDNAEVRQVNVPSFSGSVCILAKHVPTLAVFKPGVVPVYEAVGKISKYFASSGTLSISEGSIVQVLVEEAQSVSDIDVSEARQLLSQYLSAKAEVAIPIEACEARVKAGEKIKN